MSNNNPMMNPMSGEPVEADGVYSNEWGRTMMLKMGDIFPADPQLGTTTWEMVALPIELDESGRKTVDAQFRPESDVKRNTNEGVRFHVDQGDK
ncbi:hypothetical protein [Paenibacillus sp. MBLB4367]|uniref:hypothetical protein n=1 Tax=Paenibacillus sp. MBLB4367 TaxID=3384767 RepID=UPI003907F6B2